MTPFERPQSAWYVRPRFRRLWLAAGPCAVAVAHLFVTKDFAFGLALFFGVPLFVYAMFPGSGTGGEAVIHALRGLRTPNELTRMLEILYRSIGFSEANEVRITLFVPDHQTHTLHQVARYTWSGPSETSNTFVRMGTGDVGQSFTRGVQVRIDDVDALGGFIPALRAFNVEQEEAESHHNQQRKSFFSYPIQQQLHGNAVERFGVISFDSNQPSAFTNPLLSNQILPVAPVIADILMQWRAKVY